MCYPELSTTDPKPSKTKPNTVKNVILSELFHSDLNEYPCNKDFINFYLHNIHRRSIYVQYTGETMRTECTILQTMMSNAKMIETSIKGYHELDPCSQHPPLLAATMNTATKGLSQS